VECARPHVDDRRQAEGHARDHRDPEREQEDLPVHVDFGGSRNPARIGSGDQAQAAECQKQSERGARRREQQTFHNELLEQCSHSCPDRGPHSDFPTPGFRPRQEQIRHVHTRDQEHEGNCS
jgi:hypothetical protein